MKFLSSLALLASAVAARSVRLAPVFSDGDLIENQYIVVLREPEMSAYANDDDSFSQYVDEHLARAFGFDFAATQSRNISKLVLGYAAALSEDDIERLRIMSEVDFIEQQQKFYISEVQSNPPNWGLDRISQRELPLSRSYDYAAQAGQGVDAYIIDTGVNVEHEDFEGRAVWGVDAAGDGEIDGNGHGTHVASTVAGVKHGVAKKANIIAVKVLEADGTGTTAGVIQGIDWAGTHHAQKSKKKGNAKSVANMSLGGSKSNALERAVERATAKGLAFAVAAGNENANACYSSPAGAPSPITVGATEKTDKRSWFSNHGPCVDIFAPGSDITAAWIGGTTITNTISGTSMASPHVCGVMAMVLAENDFTPAELKEYILKEASTDKVKNPGYKSPNLLLYLAPPSA